MPAILKNELLGAIWHGGGKSWRAKFNEIQRQTGFVPSEPELSIDQPLIKLSKAEPVNVLELQASVATLKKEVADWQAKYSAKAISLERLERSKGVAAAQVVANVPTFGEFRDPLTQFNEIADPLEKTRFYEKHKAELSKFILNPTPTASQSR